MTNDTDHDLLIELKTVQQVMLRQVTELKEDISMRVTQLERNKLDITDSYMANYKESVEKTLRYYENRIRCNEKNIIRIMAYGTAALVIIGIIQGILSLYFR